MPKSSPSIDQLYKGLLAGERSTLAQAITITESTLASDRKTTEALIQRLLPHIGKSIRIGITGIPGVGKSTFIEKFGNLITQEGKKVCVLTIDPSSEKTKGSILGDKTRMEQLSKNPDVFIRPSPSGLALGGVSNHTLETVLICEAAGYEVILIETVGVGQSETYVRNMVDFFLLLLLAGAGDELQGIKKGIIEMADGIAITKADGQNIKITQQAKADAVQALHMQSLSASQWKPRVLTISSLENVGIDDVWRMILEYQAFVSASGFFEENRNHQKRKWIEESIEAHFKARLYETALPSIREKLVKEVMNAKLLPSEAANQLWSSIAGKA